MYQNHLFRKDKVGNAIWLGMHRADTSTNGIPDLNWNDGRKFDGDISKLKREPLPDVEHVRLTGSLFIDLHVSVERMYTY